jgi:hypothetical protein
MPFRYAGMIVIKYLTKTTAYNLHFTNLMKNTQILYGRFTNKKERNGV